MAHLVPFVEVSRQKYRRQVYQEGKDISVTYTEPQVERIVEDRLERELEAGIQTIQYQLLTLMTTNGQTPFVSMYIDMNEVPESQKPDMARLIQVVLNQRIKGVQNEKGIWITPAFPKLLYVLDEYNVHEDSPYFYLTELAAKCTAKRMVPDYISAKVMRELKHGDVYPCMGCVDGQSQIDYQYQGETYQESFEDAWNRLAKTHEILLQPNGVDHYMKTEDVEIYDNALGKYVNQYGMIQNRQSEWIHVELSFGKTIDVTIDHPFEVQGKGVILAQDVQIGDRMIVNEHTEENATSFVVFDSVAKLTRYTDVKYSYDVTTESEHFMVNGIWSHNCRSFLTPDRFTTTKGNLANDLTFDGSHKYYGRFNQGRHYAPY